VFVVIKDSNGNLFGAFSSVGLHVDSNFYGDSNCFLFTFVDGYKVFTATKENSLFIKTTNNFIAFGGPEYGLWLDSEIDFGKSKPCQTYGNTPLSGSEDFKCVQMEIWELLSKDEEPNRLTISRSTDQLQKLGRLESPKPLSPHRILLKHSGSFDSSTSQESTKFRSVSPTQSGSQIQVPSMRPTTPPTPGSTSDPGSPQTNRVEESLRIQELQNVNQKLEDEVTRLRRELELAKQQLQQPKEQ